MSYPQKNNNSRSNGNNYQAQNNGGQRQQTKKHTGAKFTRSKKDGSPVTTGWNYSKRFGLVTFLCVTTSKSVESESNTGNKYISVMIKVRKPMSPEVITNGLMNIHTGQVTCEAMQIVINPKAPNGGYCGKYGGK
jgi:hypothetical protein